MAIDESTSLVQKPATTDNSRLQKIASITEESATYLTFFLTTFTLIGIVVYQAEKAIRDHDNTTEVTNRDIEIDRNIDISILAITTVITAALVFATKIRKCNNQSPDKIQAMFNSAYAFVFLQMATDGDILNDPALITAAAVLMPAASLYFFNSQLKQRHDETSAPTYASDIANISTSKKSYLMLMTAITYGNFLFRMTWVTTREQSGKTIPISDWNKLQQTGFVCLLATFYIIAWLTLLFSNKLTNYFVKLSLALDQSSLSYAGASGLFAFLINENNIEINANHANIACWAFAMAAFITTFKSTNWPEREILAEYDKITNLLENIYNSGKSGIKRIHRSGENVIACLSTSTYTTLNDDTPQRNYCAESIHDAASFTVGLFSLPAEKSADCIKEAGKAILRKIQSDPTTKEIMSAHIIQA